MTDRLTPEKRSWLMSRVKSKDTSIEKVVRSELFRRGYRFRKNVSSLPGKPDIVFIRKRVAVFIDGDFWHGYRFREWKERRPEKWQRKIENNRRRDAKNIWALRKDGWRVIRIWQHEIKDNLSKCIERIVKTLCI